MEESPITLRRGNKKDIPFITNSWLRSYRDGLAVRSIPHDVYYYHQHRLVEQLLPRCINLVCCRTDKPDQILGYCIAEVTNAGLVLHYIYIKKSFRQLGIATQMVEQLKASEGGDPKIIHTHRTFSFKKIREAWREQGVPDKVQDWVYNPYVAWRLVELNFE